MKLADHLEWVAKEEKRLKKRKFNMGYWFERKAGCKARKIGFDEASCGTSGCAMGHAVAVFPRHLRFGSFEKMNDGSIQGGVFYRNFPGKHAAGEFFGIEWFDADHLFGGAVNRSAMEEARVLRTFATRALKRINDAA